MNIIITAGGTSEKIDGVRKITNMATGSLGSTICEKIFSNIDKLSQINILPKINVYYICNINSIKPRLNLFKIYSSIVNVKIIEIESVEDTMNIIETLLNNNKIDWIIHSMAVSDFTVKNVISQNDIIKSIEQKINSNMDKTEIMNIVNNSFLESHDYSKDTKMSSQIEDYMISLKKTIKILDQIKKISHSTKIISFKLLKDVSNEELINVGFEQLKRSNSDYVLANDLLNINQNEHKAFLIDKEKKYITLNNKSEISQEIINIILN